MSAKRRIIPVFVPHLGCVHECVFCDQRGISGTLSPPAPEEVYIQISDAIKKLPHGEAAQAAFYGGSFTAVAEKLQNALLDSANRALGRTGSIRISTRPDCIDTETVARLMSKNVRTIELGAQSMDDGVLLSSARGHRAGDTYAAAKAVKGCGAELILQMMTGLPGDTPEKSIYTARELIALKPDGVRIYPTVVVRGTRLHELFESGKYAEHSVDDAVELCAVICEMFDSAGIPVIRLGLNPSDGLSAGDAVAGAYHPALGELVQSRIYLGHARDALQRAKVRRGSSVTLSVERGKRSAMTGQRRCNIDSLVSDFGLAALTIAENEQKCKIVVVNVENEHEM